MSHVFPRIYLQISNATFAVVLCAVATVPASSSIVSDVQAGEPQNSFTTGFGPPQIDSITGIARSPTGRVYVIGITSSTAFPQPSASASLSPMSFVARLNSSGTGYDATWLSGFGSIAAIAIDSGGNVYLAGSGIAPAGATIIGPGAQTDVQTDVELMKLDPSLSNVVWQVFIGGSGNNTATAMAVDQAGNAYATGQTSSTDWPVTPGCFQSSNRASTEITGFVAVVRASGASLLWSTYLGGSNMDQPQAIAIGPNGSVDVAGSTASSDFPVTSGAFQPVLHSSATLSGTNGFVSELSSDGTKLLASTYLGGTGGEDGVLSLAADNDTSVTVAGVTDSPDFPVTIQGGAPSNIQPGSTGFVASLNANLGSLVFSEFLGGQNAQVNSVYVDSNGFSYLAGPTLGQLTTIRAVQPAFYAGACPIISPSGGVSGPKICSQSFFSLLDSSGNLSVSTYLNGIAGFEGAVANAVASDGNGDVFIGGSGALSVGGAQTEQTEGAAFLVTLDVNLTPPLLLSSGVTNGASFTTGLPAPGSLATIFCSGLSGIPSLDTTTFPFPLTLDGVTVTVGGMAAPIIALANFDTYQQIDFQVPWGIPPPGYAEAADIELSQANLAVWITQLDFASSPPGVFTIDGTNGAIQHADYSLVSPSNPANPGEVVIVYATGLGPVASLIGTDQLTPTSPLDVTSQPVNITVGGQPAIVLFAGLAPGELGVYQLNIQLPQNLASGEQNLLVSLPPVTDEKPPSFSPEQYSRISAPVKIAIQ